MKKNIFINKKNKNKYFFIITIFIIFLIIITFLLNFKKINYFIVPENNTTMYIIPDEKEGEKIETSAPKVVKRRDISIASGPPPIIPIFIYPKPLSK